ncbi:MAG TPA: penicillin-binding transpeptidase domain-containing protein [Sphingobacteriaceae bacterium]
MKSTFVLSILLLWQVDCFAQTTPSDLFHELGLKGSTTVYDYKNKKWFFTDSADARRLTLPASTFKIINSLIALETGAIKGADEIFKWDGQERTIFGGTPVPAWNQDTDLRSAYKNSTIWFYVELAKRIGRKKYRSYLKKSGYGNGDFSEKGTDFWNYGEFGISPMNQINFLVCLYEGNLPFSGSVMNTVKSIMVSESNSDFTYRDKTGWTTKDGQDIGWWVGYLQTKNNIYFFATRISKSTDTTNPDFSSARKMITKQILQKVIESD